MYSIRLYILRNSSVALVVKTLSPATRPQVESKEANNGTQCHILR